jgi:hypothetical protein
LNVWPAPSARGDFHLALVSLLQRIRSRALFPGQDGDPRSLILIITAASRAVQLVQVFKLPFDCQAIFLSPHADFSDPPAR